MEEKKPLSDIALEGIGGHVSPNMTPEYVAY
jgi:hypothetical protein